MLSHKVGPLGQAPSCRVSQKVNPLGRVHCSPTARTIPPGRLLPPGGLGAPRADNVFKTAGGAGRHLPETGSPAISRRRVARPARRLREIHATLWITPICGYAGIPSYKWSTTRRKLRIILRSF